MKKFRKNISLLLSSAIIMQSVFFYNVNAQTTNDYENHWAAQTIEKLLNESVITGYSDGSIKPDNEITRAEFVTLVNKLFSYTKKAESNFLDVEPDAWYASQFLVAKAAGYVSGDNYGHANPANNITRAEVCSIIARALNLNNVSTTDFTDSAAIPNWAKGFIGAMSKAELISGYPDGSFGASKNITRAEAFTIINNVLLYLQANDNSSNNSNNDNSNKSNNSNSSNKNNSKSNTTKENETETTTKKHSIGGGGGGSSSGGGGGSSTGSTNTDIVKVEYNLNYDVGNKIYKTDNINKGNKIVMPGNPSREGYVFAGWYEDSNCENIFDFDEQITADKILYADWIDTNDVINDDLEYAYNALEIEYEDGDFDKSVIHNVGLKTTCDEATVTWNSSNNSIISDSGVVNRPEGSDAEVILTATLNVRGETAVKQFNLTVIKQSDIDVNNIHDNSYDDIIELNGGELPRIVTTDEGKVKSIQGKYSDISIDSEENALLSLYSVKSLMGFSDPDMEFKCLTGNYSRYIKNYVFQQYYKGLEVTGRKVTIVADNNGVASNINSGYISDINLNTVPSVSLETAIMTAKEYMNSNANITNGELVIYPIDNSEYVLAYRIQIGMEFVYVNADTNYVITTSSSNLDLFEEKTVEGKGKNEYGNQKTFPVRFKPFDMLFFYMQDNGRSIKMYRHTYGGKAEQLFNIVSEAEDNGTLTGDTINRTRIGSETNHWMSDTHKTAISAYTNIIKVYDWYLKNLDHRSIDGNGMEIEVNVNSKFYKEYDDGTYGFMCNNACWCGDGFNQMMFFDNKSDSDKFPTTAAALDVVGHEYTHGVFEHLTGSHKNNGTKNTVNAEILRAIDEGYADIFGCLIEGKDYWEMGEDWQVARDVQHPKNVVYEKNPELSYIEKFDENEFKEHLSDGSMERYLYSTLISSSAEKMRHHGLSNDDIANVWYNSMYFGYDNSSDFYDVADNVIAAAKMIGFDDDKINGVIEAFEETNLYRIVVILDPDDIGVVSGKVVDAYDGVTPIVGANIKVYRNSDNLIVLNSPVTDENGQYSIELDKGTYKKIVVSADGYIPVEYYDINVTDDVLYLETIMFLDLNQNSENCKSNIKVTSGTTGLPIANANIKIRQNWNTRTEDYFNDNVYKTDNTGSANISLPAGYYTAEITFDGYTTGYCNIISSTYNKTHIVSLSPLMPEGNLRVILTWDTSVPDLDSHLAGPKTDNGIFHVYYSDMHAYDNGEEVANLDVDDTYYEGPETITLLKQINGTYKYSVYNYTGGEDYVLPNSHAKVEVYKGETLWYVFNVPTDQKGRVWNVFDLNGSVLTPINIINNDYDSITNINSLSAYSLDLYENDVKYATKSGNDEVVSGCAIELDPEENSLPLKPDNNNHKSLDFDINIDKRRN